MLAPSARTSTTVALAVSVSPGQTWLVKRTPYLVRRPSPTKLVSILPVRPMESMPWAKVPRS